MLNFLLDISFWEGLVLLTLFVSGAGIAVVLVVKKFLGPKISKQHEKIGRLLFRVTAGLIALLLSLSFANERVGQSKIIDSLEEEASMIVNSMLILDNIGTDEAVSIQTNLAEYVRLTMSDEWKATNSNPYFSDATNKLAEVYFMAFRMNSTDKEEELLKIKLLDHLSEVMRLMQVRIYSENIPMPYLIYILFVGLLFMWIFYTVYKIDVISLSFITLYNIFIGILIYFVFAMSNPLVGPLKINAHSFEILHSKGIEKALK